MPAWRTPGVVAAIAAADRSLRFFRVAGEEMKAAGVNFSSEPHMTDSSWYGEDGRGKLMTTIFEDPYGNFVQLDQRV